MAMYRYVKEMPKKKHRISRKFSFVFMIVGVSILVWTVWPILSFSTFTEQLFAQTISPISEGVRTVVPGFPMAFTEVNKNDVDYSNVNAWYPLKPQKKGITEANTYTLSIPKLKIENATVTVAGDSLDESLIHYGGTPLPGQYGNTVIFGHSTLPQFFNPKNYKSIFATLPTIKTGDEVYIRYDGVDYKYVIYELVVVEPTDLSPLEQRFDDSYLTIVTCVPPGTYWKRLNVKAKLEKTS